jgi:hypothetical protein
MKSGPLVVLLVASVVILVFVGIRLARASHSGRNGPGDGMRPEPPKSASGFMASPIWNVVGVLAGLVGAVTSVIGLLKG